MGYSQVRKTLTTLALTIIMVLCIGAAALASDISGAIYSGKITISNNGTTTENVVVTANISTQALIDSGYINSSANNTAVHDTVGEDTAYMPASGNTTDWVIWIPSIDGNTVIEYRLYAGGDAMDGKLRYFPGSEGANVTDHSSIELGDDFLIEVKGLFDTSSGADKNVIYKDSAFRVYVSASGNITASITGGNSVTATAISSGEYTLSVSANITHLFIYIDDSLEDSSAIGANVTDNENTWRLFQNYVMPYVESIKVWVK